MNSRRNRAVLKSTLRNVLKILIEEIELEIENEIEDRKRIWVRKWIGRRDLLGASNCLLRELELEDPAEYYNTLRMSEDSFDILLNKIKLKIQRADTHIRSAIPAQTKLQTVLYFLATGSSLRTLQHCFRLGKSTISGFIPEDCEMIYESLKDYIKRSTEQLTHCSTTTLEEILDNTDGVTTRTVSEKIMNICKNTIRWVLFLDILLALSVVVLLAVLEFGTIPQQHIGFYCNDPKISFKFMGDTISITSLMIGCLVMPIIVIWIAELVSHPADSYDTATGSAGSRTKQVWLWYGHYAIGITTLAFICDVMKSLIGEPRPHFLDTCKPREAENCSDQYVKVYTCTNTAESNWFVSDSSKSFPSGHAALSMYTSIFVVWYLQNRLPNRTFFLKPWLQCMICLWTVICSLSRIGDNRHHWWDVLAGDVIGFAFGVLTVTVSCHKFRLNRNASNIYSDPIENGQVNFNTKGHQSVKKLLHETTVDLSEGRELKNASSTWKE